MTCTLAEPLRLERLDAFRRRIPATGAMRTDGLVFASDAQMRDLENDEALKQVVNVACLPGIVGPSIAMPDIHWGYGFPIGGVAAFDPDDGVISPGGVGYDINCGVRLLSTPLAIDGARACRVRPPSLSPERVRSTVGAGDALLAGVVWALAQGESLETAVASGTERAVSRVIAHGEGRVSGVKVEPLDF